MIIRAGLVLFVIYILMAFVTNEYQVLILRLPQAYSPALSRCNRHCRHQYPREKVGYALSMMSTATATGGIMGPMIGGTLASLFSNRMAFGLAGMLCFAPRRLSYSGSRKRNSCPAKSASPS